MNTVLPGVIETSAVAALVAFLASPRASYLTGNDHVVDGGPIPTA